MGHRSPTAAAAGYGWAQPETTPNYGSPSGTGGVYGMGPSPTGGVYGSASPRDYPESPRGRGRERDHSPPPPPVAPNSPRGGTSRGPAGGGGYGGGGGGGGGVGPPPMQMQANPWMSSPITQVPQSGGDEPLTLPPDFIPPEPDPGSFTPLLPPKDRSMANRHTLVLDLDETLVHSSFKPVPMTDMLIDITLEGQVHQVYVKKRPYVDEFLARMTELFEVVVLTASLDVYADPVLDELDYDGYWVHHRLFRDSCANLNGSYIKDLSYLGRPLNSVIIIDNSPTSYLFQPRNAIPITSWFDDQADRELRDLIPLLEQVAVAKDIFPLLQRYQQVVARGNRW